MKVFDRARAFSPGVNANFWMNLGKNDLLESLNKVPIMGKAKNVIMFIGDGMGMSTITAARIFKGQAEGQLGEEYSLSFEKFPNVGLLKVVL
ncbi:hypothetical protein J437_LFUL013507 [Ladona fulva]|uniref:alkaline phosphatase n=1 Tax=Ladona fulva TaxID=123851 RepID=A0A8K0KE64_LADFU|nr:hypothetical protein J437_LFUL013507 [Ladona fulva]